MRIGLGLTFASASGAPLPTLSACSISTDTTSGGTPFTLTGTGLSGATGVTIGGTACTSVVVVSSTSITAVTPAKAAGTYDVVVTTPGGTATLVNQIAVAAGPTISSVNYATVGRAGATAVTATGTNLTGATALTLGGTACTSVVVVNSTTITFVTPAKTAGAYDLVVTTPGGTGTLTNGIEAWDPDVLGSCTSWYCADSNVTQAANAISSIGDKSSAGAAALTTSVVNNKPVYVAAGGAGINGRADITCPASPSKGLVGDGTRLGTTAITMWMIYKVLNGRTAVSGYWGMQYNSYHYALTVNAVASDTKVSLVTDANVRATSDSAVNNGNPHCCMATWSTADNTSRMYSDSTTVSATTGTTTSIPAAGSDKNAAFCHAQAVDAAPDTPAVSSSMPEWGSFNAVLSSGDRAKLMGYMKSQAGI